MQEFIAQARSTRDLWSGSYLLSWLMAAGVAHLVKELTQIPDMSDAKARKQVISPDLTDQPLFELHLGGRATVKAWAGSPLNDERLTPNFPNILVAWLPDDAKKCRDFADGVAAAIRNEWRNIGKACWEHGADIGLDGADLKKRWEAQLSSFPSITWQITPGFPSLAEAAQATAHLPLKKEMLTVLRGASDPYAAQAALNAWQLDAVRQLREFHAWGEGGWNRQNGLSNEKDSLTGREEAVLGGKWQGKGEDDWWATFIEPKEKTANSLWYWLFSKRQRAEHYGAITVVRRTWHWAYLKEKWKLEALHRKASHPDGKEFPFPSTFHIACHYPAKNESDRVPEEEDSRQERYFAVLAFDGDEMGKWLSGEKSGKPLTEKFHSDLSHRLGNFALRCTRPIVEACDGRLILAGGEDVLALLPADTAMACAGFLRAAYRAEPQFMGVPTASSQRGTGLAGLAEPLLARHEAEIRKQSAHGNQQRQEISPWLTKAAHGQLYAALTEGELLHYKLKGWVDHADQPQPGESCLLKLPGGLKDLDGKRPEISCGIAIAHFKEPLQDVVNEALRAEKRAKNELGRAAIAVTLVKHSGETIEWGCKWDSGGLELLAEIQRAIAEGLLSGKFPHRVIELLTPYLVSPDGVVASTPEFESIVDEIVRREFAHALDRQHGPKWRTDHDASGKYIEEFLLKLTDFVEGRPNAKGGWVFRGLRGEDSKPLDAQSKLQAVIDLCRVAAFIKPAQPTDEVFEEKSTP